MTLGLFCGVNSTGPVIASTTQSLETLESLYPGNFSPIRSSFN